MYLPELNDTVFFGQVKTFQDVQLAKSPTLQEAIDKGLVSVLEKSGTVEPAVILSSPPVRDVPVIYPAAPEPVPTVPPEPSQTDQLLGLLMSKVSDLAKTMESQQSREAVGVVSSDISEKLMHLANKIEGFRVSGPGVMEPTLGTAVKQDEFMFVPSAIRVDDLTNNISLASRSLGQGGSVNEASAALKKARQANASAQTD